ncbi:MAG: DUF362 domain-containing protein [Spirochaetota bacterium]|nr:DUF362 domain-containing protein [Spirochaetota bacterium]
MSKVYFTDFKASSKDNVFSKTKKLFEKTGFKEKIHKNEFIAIKTHFGEYGNIAYIPGQILRILVNIVKEMEGRPFITDTNTLYRGSRSNAVDHLNNAYMNGFVSEVTGAPVIIADGLRGNDFRTLNFDGKHFNEIKIASAIYDSDAVIVTTHVKGHELFGLGGALKNVAMGCVPSSGKQIIHSDLKPKVIEKRCTGCGSCKKRCPSFAISLNSNKKAVIDQEKCISCGECTVICPYGAIPVLWKTDHKSLHERTAEYVKGIIGSKPGRWIFINFIMNVAPHCDCCFWNDIPIVPDIGILASTDCVAIDRASADLVNKADIITGSILKDKKVEKDNITSLHNIEWKYLLEYAEEIGLGENRYDFIEI